jgi:hypothetical protein
MMLDDVYGSDEDQDPLEQESELWAAEVPTLEWEEIEVQDLAGELSGASQSADWRFNVC